MARKAILVFLILGSLIFAKELDIYFIDVGEGEATLIVTPDRRSVLIDTGNLITGYRVLEFLRGIGINSLDRLIVTHPHPDHAGGVFILLQSIEIKSWHDNGQPLDKNDCGDMYRWYSELFRKDRYSVLREGSSFSYGAVKFEVLNPSSFSEDWNRNSLVIRMVHGEIVALFMGDGNKSTEKYLMSKGYDLRADLLKVGHHGAGDVLLEGFLREVSPSFAVISINRDNVRGYPSRKNIELLKKHGVRVLTTYENGTIHFKSDGISLWLAR